jgi:hypothetical protein
VVAVPASPVRKRQEKWADEHHGSIGKPKRQKVERGVPWTAGHSGVEDSGDGGPPGWNRPSWLAQVDRGGAVGLWWCVWRERSCGCEELDWERVVTANYGGRGVNYDGESRKKTNAYGILR